jgi:hypothetical protein
MIQTGKIICGECKLMHDTNRKNNMYLGKQKKSRRQSLQAIMHVCAKAE